MFDLMMLPVELVAFDGEGEVGEQSKPTEPDTKPSETTGGKSFTQEEVNSLLAKDKRALRAELEKMESKLKEVLDSKSLTEQEREKLEETVEDVRKQLRTKEENARLEKKKLEEQYQAQLERVTSEALNWKTQYEQSTINRALLDAAVAGDAFNTDVLLSVLRPTTKLNSEGAVMVDMKVKNDSGEEVVQQMTPTEAVQWMRDQPNIYGGLFKGNVTGGIGGSSGSGGVMTPGKNGLVDVRKLTPEQYRKLRKENPSALGLR